MQCGIHLIDDLLGVHANGMDGRHHDQYQQYQDDCVLADVLTFFSPNLRPKPTKHPLRDSFPRFSVVYFLAELLRPGNITPGAVTAARIVCEVSCEIHGTKVELSMKNQLATRGIARSWSTDGSSTLKPLIYFGKFLGPT